jgi:hypothetical protein
MFYLQPFNRSSLVARDGSTVPSLLIAFLIHLLRSDGILGDLLDPGFRTEGSLYDDFPLKSPQMIRPAL